MFVPKTFLRYPASKKLILHVFGTGLEKTSFLKQKIGFKVFKFLGF